MAGADNLKGKGFDEMTAERQRAIASAGGKASQEARRRRKELKACIEALLESNIKDKNGREMSGAEALTSQLFKKALDGDVRAFEVLRDTAGQKPVERVVVTEIDEQAAAEVEDMVAAAKYETDTGEKTEQSGE